MTLERILLQTIKFDLQVEHPYSYLLKYAKCLKGNRASSMPWRLILHTENSYDILQVIRTNYKRWFKWLGHLSTTGNDDSIICESTKAVCTISILSFSLCTTLSLQWEPEIIAVALMYLAGKLSKFEVVDWNGRQTKHLRWWDMFVEDVTMDLLEGYQLFNTSIYMHAVTFITLTNTSHLLLDICHQVLDLYSQANNTKTPDSPPMTPSNEPCRDRGVTAPPVESASTTPNGI